jgi:ABC-type lipoprotein release transport system permease subunit
MFVLIKMGFRNTLRNKRRTLLTTLAIGLGIASLIMLDGLLIGMYDNMVKNITNSFIGHGQIHHKDFKQSFKVEDQINNIENVEKILENDKMISSYSKRVLSFGMISSPRNMRNITVVGIDPEKEKFVSNTHKFINSGNYISNEKSIVIGKKLAKRLEVEIGDKIIITLSQANSGDVTQDMFRISGILSTGTNTMDEQTVLIHLKKAQKLLNIKGFHEISLKFINESIVEENKTKIWEKLNSTKNLSKSWKKIMSSFVSIVELQNTTKYYLVLILMLFVGLGLVNTLFMAIYERMFEYTVLRALGTKGWEIILIIVSESLMLTGLSILVAFVFCLLLGTPMYIWGIDYSGIEFASVTFVEPLRYYFEWKHYVVNPIGALVFTLIVSLYPAIHASRLTVAQTLKKTL